MVFDTLLAVVITTLLLPNSVHAIQCYDSAFTAVSTLDFYVPNDETTVPLISSSSNFCYWEQLEEGIYKGYIDKGDESRFNYICTTLQIMPNTCKKIKDQDENVGNSPMATG
jgi:hypothetical protein